MSEIANSNPFVGLRPFESDEGLLFFGRQEQTMELLQRLHQYHFVAIVGSSGCGKSSLIRAGLIPRLKAGYLVNERDRWLIPVFKPGEDPLYNFAFSLLTESGKASTADTVKAFVQKIKEEGTDAIIELLQPTINEEGTNVFILVDQFEELFRFSIDANDVTKRDEAIDFVNILLELSGHAELPVYVVITMRSDFIGDCAQFYGLPEALNKSQYLVPRLTRMQLKNAIEGPVRLYGGKINPALTSRLLNDIQNVKDELPLLQHVLMRSWDYEMKTDKNGELGLEDYKEVGEIGKALSIHAEEALAGMNKDEKHVAELMFQVLTAVDKGGRKIRQPAHLRELVSLTNVSSETIIKIIDHFNADKRSFLVVNESADTNDPLIDISHESLIRQWDTLNGWVNKEAESAKIYLRLSEALALNKERKKDLITGTELQVFLNWRAENIPSATWAGRYNKDYAETMAYLEKSKAQYEADKLEKEELRRKQLRRTRIFMGIISVIGIIALITSIFAFITLNKARESEEATKAALKRFEDAEAGKVEMQVYDILERADSLKKSNYVEIHNSMKIEAINILKKYSNNGKLMQLKDSIEKTKIIINE
ncbi:hypothetical protein BH10BAC2_BH10BAC2_22770 [soil metagenome]